MSTRLLAFGLLVGAMTTAALLLFLGHSGQTRAQRLAGSAGLPDPRATNRAALATAASTPTAPLVAAIPRETPAFAWPAEAGWTMEVAEAVMVTADLDFGPKIPSIAEALRSVDRHYQPADGQGRTFAILDAYGEPTAAGQLHISMHVSSEKPGRGALVFGRTGQVLWQARILPSAHPSPAAFTGKNLDIMIADERGNDHLLDGSGGSPSIWDAIVRDQGLPLREVWPDGAERQLTFFYSACGCPVKVRCRRLGERTLRTKDRPVIFPDDPAVVATLTRLLGWGEP